MLEAGFELLLVNAEHLKGVPGRKTDLLTELPGRSLRWCARAWPWWLARFACS